MMIGVTVSASWAWAVEVRLFGGTSKLSDYFCRETQRGEIVELFGVGFDDERGTGDLGRQHTKFNRLRAIPLFSNSCIRVQELASPSKNLMTSSRPTTAANVKKAWPKHRSRYPGGEKMAVGDCEMRLRDLSDCETGLVLVPSPEYCR